MTSVVESYVFDTHALLGEYDFPEGMDGVGPRKLKKQIDALKNAEKHSTGIIWAFSGVKLAGYLALCLFVIGQLIFTKAGKEGHAFRERQTMFFVLLLCFAGIVYNTIYVAIETLPLYFPTSAAFSWYEHHVQVKNAIHQPAELLYVIALYFVASRIWMTYFQTDALLKDVKQTEDRVPLVGDIESSRSSTEMKVAEGAVSAERVQIRAYDHSAIMWVFDVSFMTLFCLSAWLSFAHRAYFFYYYAGCLMLFAAAIIAGVGALHLRSKYDTKDFLRARPLWLSTAAGICGAFILYYTTFVKSFHAVATGYNPDDPDFSLATFLPLVTHLIWVTTYVTMTDLYLGFMLIYLTYQVSNKKTTGFCSILNKDVPRLVYLKNQGLMKRTLLDEKPETNLVQQAQANLDSYSAVQNAIGQRNLNLSVALYQTFTYNCDFVHDESSKVFSLLLAGQNAIDQTVSLGKASQGKSMGDVTQSTNANSSGSFLSQTLASRNNISVF